MSKKATSALLGVLGLLSLLLGDGMQHGGRPELWDAQFPDPVSPYFQKEAEDRYWNHKRYDRMPILGPITPGSPETASGSAVGRRGDEGVGKGAARFKAVCPSCTKSNGTTCGSWSSRSPTMSIRCG